MNINVKLLRETSKLPTKAHSTDACFDIYADLAGEDWVAVFPDEQIKIKAGFSTEIPQGYFCSVFARSGLGINKGLRPSNCVGIIDSDYRGEWVIAIRNDGDERQIIRQGDRIAQFAIQKVYDCTLTEVSDLTDTERGEGGLGSSGN